jgi:hypothetical protein
MTASEHACGCMQSICRHTRAQGIPPPPGHPPPRAPPPPAPTPLPQHTPVPPTLHYRCRDRQMLTIPFATLKAMPEGPLTLRVDMVNIFGIKSSTSLTLRKKNATQAPLFTLDQSQLRFFPSQGFRIDALPLPSACPNTQVCRGNSSQTSLILPQTCHMQHMPLIGNAVEN